MHLHKMVHEKRVSLFFHHNYQTFKGKKHINIYFLNPKDYGRIENPKLSAHH